MASVANVPPPAVVHALHEGAVRWTSYTIRRGDSLTEIARAHHTTVAALARHNKIADPNRVKAGQRIQVPTRTTSSKSAKHKPAKHKSTKHRSAKHSSSKHRPANHKSHRTAKKTPARVITWYVVRRGDSLYSIAAARHTSVAALVKANRIANPAHIIPGAKLRIPGRPAPAAHHATASNHGAPASPHSSVALTIADRTFLGRTYPESVVRQAAATRHYLSTRPVPTRSQTRSLIVSTARRYGVDPHLALGIAWQESGWNQRAVSVCNAIGIMQVMPASGTWAEQLGGGPIDLLDARDNVRAGVLLLRYNVANAANLDEAIAGYYQGLAGVKRYGMYPDTKAYVRAVRAHMKRF